MPEQKPLVNAHTHIFTGVHVPPFLARSFLPWPLYYLVYTPLVMWFVRAVRDNWIVRTLFGKQKKDYDGSGAKSRKLRYGISAGIRRNLIFNFLYWALGVLIIYHAFYVLYDWVDSLMPAEDKIERVINWPREQLSNFFLTRAINNLPLRILVVLVGFVFIKSGRRAILFIFSKIWSVFGIFQGDMGRSMIDRYVLMGRYSVYQRQSRILSRLIQQFPADTQFVVLPMDMEYMGAGKSRESYLQQMEELVSIKKGSTNSDSMLPFIFMDPRRIDPQEDARTSKPYFDWDHNHGDVVLKECHVKDYLDAGFNGFKIYPALGYYPFDEKLLAAWKYAADHGIPIMTHCIRGAIFYRGPKYFWQPMKKKEWDTHPVFEEPETDADGTVNFGPLLLPEFKPKNLQVIFTHPLNYLCLLDEKHLRVLVSKAKDARLKKLFGYNGANKKMDHDLAHLKICFAHFGGEDEWHRYLERDREPESNHLIKYPDRGLDFRLEDPMSTDYTRGKSHTHWRSIDWYSIITSLMLQFDNVYADISYILHEAEIFPLLKSTLDNPGLRERVLFGTDFYVVRNHKSDKQMFVETRALLSDAEFDQIARENTFTYLQGNGDIAVDEEDFH